MKVHGNKNSYTILVKNIFLALHANKQQEKKNVSVNKKKERKKPSWFLVGKSPFSESTKGISATNLW